MSLDTPPSKEKQVAGAQVLKVGQPDCAEDLQTVKKVDTLARQVLQGKYEILEKLGTGGMGVVYKARDLTLDRLVALKVFSMDAAAHEKSFLRFQQEARAAGHLNHDGIVGVHELSVSDEGLAFLVMDFVDGVSLSEVLAQVGPLTLKKCLELSIWVADALSYAHDKGVIHRDLKPANIMLVPDLDTMESIKIVDFGIAKRMEEGRSLTQTGEVFGSPLYMSPEQCTGQKVDLRSDIYSLGCVLYETLAGCPPHVGESALATALMHLNEPVLPLSAVQPERKHPEALQLILDRALHKDLSLRYQSMSEFRSDLQKLQDGNLDALSEIGAAQKRQRVLNAVKQRLAILMGITSLVGASFCNNPTLTGFLYLLGGLFLIFSIPGLRGDGPVSLALRGQSRITIPISRFELIVWIIFVPLLLGAFFFFSQAR